MSKIHHFSNFSVKESGIVVDVDMSRLESNYNKAQFALDSAIMTSMEPYMPMDTGQFISITKGMSAAVAGTGQVVAAAPPSGRFLYEGVAMVGRNSRSAWAKKAEKKVTTGKPLRYSRAGAQSHWFDKAKEVDGDSWVQIVKNIVGGDG